MSWASPPTMFVEGGASVCLNPAPSLPIFALVFFFSLLNSLTYFSLSSSRGCRRCLWRSRIPQNPPLLATLPQQQQAPASPGKEKARTASRIGNICCLREGNQRLVCRLSQTAAIPNSTYCAAPKKTPWAIEPGKLSSSLTALYVQTSPAIHSARRLTRRRISQTPQIHMSTRLRTSALRGSFGLQPSPANAMRTYDSSVTHNGDCRASVLAVRSLVSMAEDSTLSSTSKRELVVGTTWLSGKARLSVGGDTTGQKGRDDGGK
ncbi:hypothetical protein QBC45DRAFT_230501 [Copromyces sp. CBS 386.78]|nr:hypothetical protein QBC45DRAFT_230501 [Copromyces sp. CBS 386.78]